MKTELVGGFYNKVVTECSLPEIVDVSSDDYTAKKFNKNGAEDGSEAEQKPFIICHSEEVTLKVVTWLGKTITWTFTTGPYPMPLKQILTDDVNTATSIQISY